MNKFPYALLATIAIQSVAFAGRPIVLAPASAAIAYHKLRPTVSSPAPRERNGRQQVHRPTRQKVEVTATGKLTEARPKVESFVPAAGVAKARPHFALSPERTHQSASKAMPCTDKARAPRRRGPTYVIFPSGECLPVVRGAIAGSLEYYDPNRSGNPLLDTSGANRRKMLSDNFSVDEYARSGGTPFTFARIDPQHVACLQKLRDSLDRPVRIFSGYRPFKYNLDLYRAKGERPTRSQHSSGRGTDVRVNGLTGLEIGKAAIDACGPNLAIGLGPDYAHLDSRGRSASWKYVGTTGRQFAALRLYRQTKTAVLSGRDRKRRGGPSRASLNTETAGAL
jgi:hypothetical protein